MAKKKFNISSTLNKNKKTAEPEEEMQLAPKVPLKSVEKDPEEIKSKVDEIHSKEPVTESEPPEEATPAPKRKSSSRKKSAKPAEKERIVRMTIDTPEQMHLELKIKSIQARMSMRDYVLRLIEKDLKKKG